MIEVIGVTSKAAEVARVVSDSQKYIFINSKFHRYVVRPCLLIEVNKMHVVYKNI